MHVCLHAVELPLLFNNPARGCLSLSPLPFLSPSLASIVAIPGSKCCCAPFVQKQQKMKDKSSKADPTSMVRKGRLASL